MGQRIELKSKYGLRVEISKLERGINADGSPVIFANSILYFSPFSEWELLMNLEKESIIERLCSIADYGDGLGGFSCVIHPGSTFEDFVEAFKRNLHVCDITNDFERQGF